MTDKNSMAGAFLFLSLLASVLQEFGVLTYDIVPGLFAWIAALLLFVNLKGAQKKITLFITLLGLLGCAAGWSSGDGVDLVELLNKNQNLIALFISVTFLRLVAFPVSSEDEPLPRGPVSFVRTYWGIHFFGAVINLSAVMLVGDRFYKEKALSKLQTVVLTRAFSACANWSPFFAAFAVALIYAPNASLPLVWVTGAVSIMSGFAITWWQVKRAGELADFRGFPVHFETLWLPAVLMLMVISGSYLFPSTKVIIMIAVCALLITSVVLLFRSGTRQSIETMGGHITEQLPKMQGELILFLAAGIMGVGLASFIQTQGLYLSLDQFTGFAATITLVLMVLASVIGVHPIISIALVGETLSHIGVDHTLLAVMFLMSWAIGVNVGPFSGLNIALQGRYNLSAKSIFNWNKGYAFFMTVSSCIVLLFLNSYLEVNGA